MRRTEVRLKTLFDLVIKDYRDSGQRSLGTLLVNIEKHLEPYFVERVAQRIRSYEIEAYKAYRRREGASPATINLELATLRRAYNLGLQHELLKQKPKITLYPVHNARKGFFEPEDYKKQLAAVPEYMKNVLRFGYLSGWRQGEIFTLKWAVNYDEQSVRLMDSKSRRGRVLPLQGELKEIIDEQLKKRRADCPFIFHYDGRPLNRTTFNKHWNKARRESGANRLFHDLRRTAVRNLMRAGVHRAIAKQMTGHETDHIFERYDIVDEADILKGQEKLERYLRKVHRNGRSQNEKHTASTQSAERPEPESTTALSPDVQPNAYFPIGDDVLAQLQELGVA